MNRAIQWLMIAGLLLLPAGCRSSDTGQSTNGRPKQDNQSEGTKMDIKVSSPAFEEGQMIPSKYTCDGQDISPPLEWSGVPAETRSIALIADDPDAPMGTWVHWVIFNLSADVRSLPEALKPNQDLPGPAVQATTSFGRTGYGGPCPPSGTHRYYFKVYALDTSFDDLDKKSTKEDLLEAMEGHILAQGQLMGRYEKK